MLKREAPRKQSEYVYRRGLAVSELLPAIGIGLGVGAVAFYFAYLFLQRTPLEPKRVTSGSPAKRLVRGAAD